MFLFILTSIFISLVYAIATTGQSKPKKIKQEIKKKINQELPQFTITVDRFYNKKFKEITKFFYINNVDIINHKPVYNSRIHCNKLKEFYLNYNLKFDYEGGIVFTENTEFDLINSTIGLEFTKNIFNLSKNNYSSDYNLTEDVYNIITEFKNKHNNQEFYEYLDCFKNYLNKI